MNDTLELMGECDFPERAWWEDAFRKTRICDMIIGLDPAPVESETRFYILKNATRVTPVLGRPRLVCTFDDMTFREVPADLVQHRVQDVADMIREEMEKTVFRAMGVPKEFLDDYRHPR